MSFRLHSYHLISVHAAQIRILQHRSWGFNLYQGAIHRMRQGQKFLVLFTRSSWFRVTAMKTVLLSYRPFNSEYISFLKALVWKYIQNFPVAFAWVSFLCPALVPYEFWAKLSGDQCAIDRHGNPQKNAFCRLVRRGCYPCESSDGHWTSGLSCERDRVSKSVYLVF